MLVLHGSTGKSIAVSLYVGTSLKQLFCIWANFLLCDVHANTAAYFRPADRIRLVSMILVVNVTVIMTVSQVSSLHHSFRPLQDQDRLSVTQQDLTT